MFWRDTELSWWWYRAPIETQAMMIEAFDEVMNDAAGGRGLQGLAAEAEADAGLEDHQGHGRRGLRPAAARRRTCWPPTRWSKSRWAAQAIKPEKVEAGTGFYEQRFVRGEIKPEMGEITVKKVDEGVAWGSVHWQYLEDMTKVTPYEGTPLKLQKTLYTKRAHEEGPGAGAGHGPGQGRRRTGRADRAARRPRHGVRPPEGPARQRHRAGQRAVAVQVPGRPGATTNRRATRPATSSSTTCPRARTSSSTAIARRSTGASTRPAWPRSSACTPRSSTATRRASCWR